MQYNFITVNTKILMNLNKFKSNDFLFIINNTNIINKIEKIIFVNNEKYFDVNNKLNPNKKSTIT